MAELTKEEIENKQKELNELKKRFRQEKTMKIQMQKSMKKTHEAKVAKAEANGEINLDNVESTMELLRSDLESFEKELHNMNMNFNKVRKVLIQIEKRMAETAKAAVIESKRAN